METNEKLLSAIFNVARLIKEKIHMSDCLAGFTNTEIEILKLLNNGKPITMKSIADYLHIKPSSVTPVIDKLVKKGNIKRVQKLGDRRVVNIELTPKGSKSLQKAYKYMHKTIGGVFKKLAEKDKKNLIKIFEKIHEKNT